MLCPFGPTLLTEQQLSKSRPILVRDSWASPSHVAGWVMEVGYQLGPESGGLPNESGTRTGKRFYRFAKHPRALQSTRGMLAGVAILAPSSRTTGTLRDFSSHQSRLANERVALVGNYRNCPADQPSGLISAIEYK